MTEQFDEAVRALALEDGVEHLLSIPGVWECISEYYNNAAIDKMKEDAEDAGSDTDILPYYPAESLSCE